MSEHPLAQLSTYPLDRDASPATEQAIAAFEADIGGKLPADYRRFLATSGPIGIEDTARLELDGGASASVSVLYGLGCDPDWDLRHQTFDVYSGRIPDETIPIGEDGDTGDQALLVFEGSRRGEVYLWLHDHPEIDSARLDQMRADLASDGHDLGTMNDAAVIYAWEHAHVNELGRPPLWGNLHKLASSFDQLLARLSKK